MTKARYGYYYFIHWKDYNHKEIVCETEREWFEEPTNILREIKIKLGIERRKPCVVFAFEDEEVKRIWESIQE